MVDDLIYDIGAHTGEDTDFYLGKGFRVVAVEANPQLVSHLRSRFRSQIEDGRLAVIDRAIGGPEIPDTVDLFVNDAKDDWSALDELTASKGTMDVRRVAVKTTHLTDLFATHGVPYFLKVDIELSDIDVAQSLSGLPNLPRYVSFEMHDVRVAAFLEAAGYRHYQLISQFMNGFRQEVSPPKEGNAYWPGSMGGTHSGLFGRELPESDWVDFEGLMSLWLAYGEVRKYQEGSGIWLDVHARLEGD